MIMQNIIGKDAVHIK